MKFFHLKDNVQKVTFLFKISLSTLNFSLFCGNINDTALSDIAFPERPYNENDFEFQWHKFCISSFLDQFQIWNLDDHYLPIKSLCKCKCLTKLIPKLI